MESLLHRYRNITVLFVAIIAQIAAVAWQVRRDNDVPLLRIWAISAVTPAASAIENLRSGTFGVFSDFFSAHGSRDQSRALRTERDRLKLENQLLKNELAEAQRAGTLAGFKAHSPSRMIGARVIGTTTGMGSRSVLIDTGYFAGVRKGMAVVTPDGIVGKVLEVYPSASQVLSVTDAGFAAAVESQKNHTRAVLKGMGSVSAKLDYIPTGQKVEMGETFFTSGDDRVFPRGMPVGKVTSVEDGATFQEIYLEPFGAEAAPEQVFVIVDPVHQEIPEVPPADAPVFLGPDTQSPDANSPETPMKGTQADQIADQYRKIGAAQNHVYGGGGAAVPNFNLKVPGVNAPAAAGASGATGMIAARPATGGIVRLPAGGSGGMLKPRSSTGGMFARTAAGATARSAATAPDGFAKSASGLVRTLPRAASGSVSALPRAASGSLGALPRAASGSLGALPRAASDSLSAVPRAASGSLGALPRAASGPLRILPRAASGAASQSGVTRP
jgi:rod shape-determining protein MreC